MRGEREREGVERKQENRCWGGKIIAHCAPVRVFQSDRVRMGFL